MATIVAQYTATSAEQQKEHIQRLRDERYRLDVVYLDSYGTSPMAEPESADLYHTLIRACPAWKNDANWRSSCLLNSIERPCTHSVLIQHQQGGWITAIPCSMQNWPGWNAQSIGCILVYILFNFLSTAGDGSASPAGPYIEEERKGKKIAMWQIICLCLPAVTMSERQRIQREIISIDHITLLVELGGLS